MTNSPKHDNQLATRLYENQPTNAASGSNEKRLKKLRELGPAEQIAATVYVWKKYRFQFGKRWIADYGEAKVENETFVAWMETFLGLSMAQLVHGAKLMFDEAPEHPPNLARFVKYCMTSHDNSPEVQKYLNPPEVTKPNPEGFQRIQKEQGKVARMSTERGPEFVHAARHLGIRLPKELEEKYLARGAA